MRTHLKTVLAATALSLGLAATPALAQVSGYERAPGYNNDGTLNVFGAHIDPLGGRSVVFNPLAPVDALTTGALGDRTAPRYGVDRYAPAF